MPERVFLPDIDTKLYINSCLWEAGEHHISKERYEQLHEAIGEKLDDFLLEYFSRQLDGVTKDHFQLVVATHAMSRLVNQEDRATSPVSFLREHLDDFDEQIEEALSDFNEFVLSKGLARNR